MMNNLKLIISLVAALLLPATALAQDDLTKEIVVDKDYVPVEQKAVKLKAKPVMVKIAPTSKELSYSDKVSPVATGNGLYILSPYGYKTAPDYLSTRGYLHYGVGSFLNMAGDAGYRIIDNDKTRLSIALSHTSTWSGKPLLPSGDKDLKQRFYRELARIDFLHAFKSLTLTADIHYKYAYQNYLANIGTTEVKMPESKANEIGFNVMGKRNPGSSIDCHVGLGLNYFSIKQNSIRDFDSHETHLNLNAGVSSDWENVSRIGIDASIDYLFLGLNNEIALASFASRSIVIGGYNSLRKTFDGDGRGIFAVTPYATIQQGNFTARLGAKVQLGIKEGGFKVAPDVRFDLHNTSRSVGAFVSLNGGLRLNDYATLFNADRYLQPCEQYVTTNTPIDARIGLNFGPFSGFKASLWAGYSVTKDAYDWVIASNNEGYNAYIFHDVKGFGYGASLSYSYGSILEASAGISATSNDADKGYYTGLLRSDFDIDARIRFSPIKPLSITVEYRGLLDVNFYQFTRNSAENWSLAPYSKENAHILSLAARYKINNLVAVWASANNLLNKEYRLTPVVYEQKFNVMGGVSLSF